MPHYKDAANKVHFLDDAAFEHLLPTGCIAITEEEADLLIPKLSKTQLKNKEIKERTSQYKMNNRELQLSWLSALVVDGAAEVDKKAAILLDIEDLRVEYNSDIAAIKLKYL